MVKNLPASAGDIGDTGFIPGWERSPGGENGNPLQYSCLENPADRGGWWATVHGVTKSDMIEHVCVGRIGTFTPASQMWTIGFRRFTCLSGDRQ